MNVSQFFADAKRALNKTACVEIDRAFAAVEAFRNLPSLAPNSPAYKTAVAEANEVIGLAIDRTRASLGFRHIAVTPLTGRSEWPDVTDVVIREIATVEAERAAYTTGLRKTA